MNHKNLWRALCLLAMIALLAACAPRYAAPVETEQPLERAAVVKTVEVSGDSIFTPAATPYPPAAPLPQMTALAAQEGGAMPAGGELPSRLIIKNAELRLLVEDTQAASERLTQVVEDLGGYIISSRVWIQEQYGENYQYATYTLGIPVDQFETALRRLRGLSVEVLDEIASGQDVSDEYVDLQSRLENLQATRDRIREFLDQAQDVEEALKVNAELSRVEEQIEMIQGRMNYLFERAAISTITVHLEPQTVGVTPTPTSAAWDPANTIGDANRTLVTILRGLVDAAIWFGIVILPLVCIPVLFVYLLWRFGWRRKRRKQDAAEAE